ncbi:hypothetical protein [Oceanirhabdus seepicola]|uniref:Pilus assembly protein PilO n=1 Tax=Oceanirhabdus seepicola TaxID=2828781 RepID=A0A9J6P2V6_9CLOT|nr:hypothetical protein [Oceanirhabdus seepicola]MCM1990843.1 hypothetical protein [Oceanirhabdus seepicola]
MNMTRREKVMVMVLFAVISMFLYSKFLLNPRQEKLQSLREEKIQLEQRVKMIDQKDRRDKQNIKLIEELTKEVNSLSLDLFNFIGEEDVIAVMDEIIDNSGIHINNMSITQKSNEILSINSSEGVNGTEKSSIEQAYDKVSASNKDEVAKEDIQEMESQNDDVEGNGVSIAKMGVTLSYKGDFNQLMKFISEIEAFRRKIVIRNINITSGEMFQLTGNIALELYYLPIMNDEEYMKFYNSADRNNPFVSKNLDSTILDFMTKKADVSMMLKPTSSDLPTMNINLSNGNSESAVVLESATYENCKISIREEEEKYYIKYSIGDLNFPHSGYEIFTPNSEDMIKIEVSSTKRNSDKDNNGVNVIIENETSLPVKVKVIGDDQERPRFLLIDSVGKVELK